MRYFYRAYGLNLVSDTALLSLATNSIEHSLPDVTLTFDSKPSWVIDGLRLPSTILHSSLSQADSADPTFCLGSRGLDQFFELTYSDGTHFFIDGRTERLWGTCAEPLTIEDLATYLLGPLMGFVLRRRGILALHASAVSVEGKAVLLCGESASGKSTTAAALATGGVPVLAEDISPIREEQSDFFVDPGYPRVCLWPDTVEKLFGISDALPQLTPTWEKRFLPLDGAQGNFESERRQLGAIYLLSPRSAEDDAPRIETLGKREALLYLVQNTYMNWLLDRAQRAAELDALVRIVDSVPVRRIVAHCDSARIGALCELIVADAGRPVERQAVAAAGSGC